MLLRAGGHEHGRGAIGKWVLLCAARLNRVRLRRSGPLWSFEGLRKPNPLGRFAVQLRLVRRLG
eukprot:7346343-Pyramimonas_sp.AAC.1